MRESANKKREKLQKVTQKRAGQMLEKSRKAEQKKSFATRYARAGKAFIFRAILNFFTR